MHRDQDHGVDYTRYLHDRYQAKLLLYPARLRRGNVDSSRADGKLLLFVFSTFRHGFFDASGSRMRHESFGEPGQVVRA